MDRLESDSDASGVPDGPSPSAHVAVICSGYPPIAHVCGTRGSQMALGLSNLGLRVTVITADWRPSDVERPRSVEERGVTVVRVDPREWYPTFNPTEHPFSLSPPSTVTVVRRLRSARGMLGWGPWRAWARRALRELLAVHARSPINVVWAIDDDGPHQVAASFHRRARVPWVADFKDPWDGPKQNMLWPVWWFVTWRRLQTCSALTETCRAQGELDARFGRPWHVVWSGYDPEAMRQAKPVRVSSRFTLGYFGNVIPAYHDLPHAARMLRACMCNSDGAPEAELHVFGYSASTWREALAREKVVGLLHEHGFVPRDEAFSRMKGADVLLMLPVTKAANSGVLGVKELEYLASGTPVLCVGRLLPELRNAIGQSRQLVEAEDEGQAVRFLREEYLAFSSGASSPRRGPVNAPSVAACSWPAQARRLADILQSAMPMGGESAKGRCAG
ncbi:hypothetical protein ACFL5O_01195 [Myxococcota bacterium]